MTAGLALVPVLLTLVAGCSTQPVVTRQVSRAVLGEIFVISD